MAIGCGLYIPGVSATGLILLVQTILHKNIRIFMMPKLRLISLRQKETLGVLEQTLELMQKHKIQVIDTKIRKEADGMMN